MAENSSIQWTQATWNFVTGCTKISDECLNCYITKTPPFRMAGRKFDQPGIGGTTGVTLHPDKLMLPLRWRNPRKVFVNSLADLFHEAVPVEVIAKAFAVMSLAPQHTFQCLTKRPARMRSLLCDDGFKHQVAQAADAIQVDRAHKQVETWMSIPDFEGYEASSHGRVRSATGILSTHLNPQTGRPAVTLWNHGSPKTMPVHRLVMTSHVPSNDSSLEVCHRNGDKTDNRLANLRWGTRSENQREKVRHGSRGGPQKLTPEQVQEVRDSRLQGLTQQVVADRFGISRSLVSMIENGHVWAGPQLTWPLPNVHLGVSAGDQKWADIRIPILLKTPAAVRFVSAEPLLGPIKLHRGHGYCPTHDFTGGFCSGPCPDLILPDWIIIGGESGPGARPMEMQWARDLVADCRDAGIAPFVKQMGSAWARDWSTGGKSVAAHGDTKGGDPQYWPADLRVREYPQTAEAVSA